MSTDQLGILGIVGAVAVLILAIMGYTWLAWILAAVNIGLIFLAKQKS